MDLATRRKYYNLCDPYKALGPKDPSNIDIDAFGSDDEPVRGERWSSKLALQIELAEGRPVCTYFSGLGGSGKSTELRRLMARLEEKDGAHLLPILVDAEKLLDLTNEIDIPDILIIMLHETDRQIYAREHEPASGGSEKIVKEEPAAEAKQDSLFRLRDLFANDMDLSKAEIGIQLPGFGAKFVGDMRASKDVRLRVRRAVAANMTTFIRELQAEFGALDLRAQALGYRGLVVILDSMEKLRGISVNFKEVLESAERVFAQDAPYLRLPVHAIYTIPPAVAHRLTAPVHYMPMIKIMDAKERDFLPGIEVARLIIRGRIPDDDLRQILGPDMEKRVDEIIERSGGYPREIVRLLRLLLQVEDFPLSEAAFRRLLVRAGDPLRELVEGSGQIEWLATVRKKKKLILDTEDHRQVASQMLANNVILRYMNDSYWYDLHPAVRELPEIKEAMSRIE